MNELEKCLRQIDQILGQISDINAKLAARQLVSDMDVVMAVVEAENIVKGGY